MKRITLLSAFLLLPLVAVAQDATLFDSSIHHGGYGGLITKVTSINGEAALMTGLEAVWIINHNAYVGAQGHGIVNKVAADLNQPNGKPYLLWVNEAGGRAGYIHQSEDMLHFSGGAFIGAGSVQLADRWAWRDPSEVEVRGDEDYYFIVEPEVAAEMNVTSWMRTKLGASYRIVSGVESEGVTNSDLGGPAASLTLMFGWF